jgi:hypothetical protein
VGVPDIALFAELLHPVDPAGPERFIYAYTRENGTSEVAAFLEQLRQTAPGRFVHYSVNFRRVGLDGRGRGDKYHPLKTKTKIPKGIAKDASGRELSLSGMVVFKNNSHQSRIYGCTEPDGLIILLTVYEGKKEDDLTADAINPALYAREEYFARKGAMLSRKRAGSLR